MTRSELQALMTRLAGAYPSLRLTDSVMAVWGERLLRVNYDVALGAYTLLLDRSDAFAPSLPQFLHAIAEVEQGPPPSAEEMDRIIGDHASRWPYMGHMADDERTVAALEELTAAGVHEAVLRYVRHVGAYRCSMMPDGTRYELDREMRMEQAKLYKLYREECVAGWLADPRPGRALAEARDRVGIGGGSNRGPRRLGDRMPGIDLPRLRPGDGERSDG